MRHRLETGGLWGPRGAVIRTVGAPPARRRRAPLALAVALSFALFGAASTPLTAQNLLVNPGFDTDLGDWGTGGAPFPTWDGSEGNPPGSALLEFGVEVAGVPAVHQCVDGVIPGETYAFGGQFRVDAAPDGGAANVTVFWLDVDCASISEEALAAALGVVAATPVLQTTGTPWQGSDGTAAAPPGAVSAWVFAPVGLPPLGPGSIEVADIFDAELVSGDYLVNADNFYFQLLAEPVPTMGALWLAGLALLLALVAAMKLRA